MNKAGYPRRYLGGLVLVLASLGQTSIAAEVVSGQITAVDLARDSVEVDGVAYRVSNSVKHGATPRLKDIRPGQGVRIEADQGTINRIELIRLPPT